MTVSPEDDAQVHRSIAIIAAAIVHHSPGVLEGLALEQLAGRDQCIIRTAARFEKFIREGVPPDDQ